MQPMQLQIITILSVIIDIALGFICDTVVGCTTAPRYTEGVTSHLTGPG